MEKYESRQQQIRRPAAQIYSLISDFSNFTPVVQGHVEEWTADETHCSFRVKGMTVRLHMVDRVPEQYVKIAGDERSPLDFTFWIQLKEVGAYDTRMRLVLHAKLNMVMKMMIGSKLQSGLDRMAEQMARAFNGEL
ncbi:MAG TPA: SRPBCC family protein [Candidatus Tidjanibacter gallistercoris]|nr:SRPBCC family protein [Candidatus Tidjanibacter gallistercoris]